MRRGCSCACIASLKGSEQHTAAKDGPEDVASFLSRYDAVEQAYLKCGIVRIKDGDKAAVIQLSTGILEVRAKTARYFDRRTSYRVLLNIIKADDWHRPSTQIEKPDALCKESQRNYGSLER